MYTFVCTLCYSLTSLDTGIVTVIAVANTVSFGVVIVVMV